MEKIKNFLVVFLSFTMCLLCYVSLIIMSGDELKIPKWLEGSEYRASYENKTGYKTSALPYRISVIAGGTVYTEQGIDKDDAIYNDCEKLIMEALGSMGEPNECSFAEYRDAVADKSLVLHYNGSVPMWLLQMWSGSKGSFDGICRFVVLTKDAAKGVRIYFREDETGKYYKAATSADIAVLGTVTAKYVTGNGRIASAADMDILSENNSVLKVYGIRREAPGFEPEKEENLLRAFGLNPYLAKNYQESGGAKVYVEENNILKISAGGRITYTSSGEGIGLSEEDESLTYAEKTALALNKLGEVSHLLYADMPNVSAEAVSVKNEGDRLDIGLIIKIDGVPVDENVYGAGIVLNGSSIVRMWIDMPNIFETGESVVMSDTLAKAAYDKEGRYELMYTAQGDSLTAVNSFVR